MKVGILGDQERSGIIYTLDVMLTKPSLAVSSLPLMPQVPFTEDTHQVRITGFTFDYCYLGFVHFKQEDGVVSFVYHQICRQKGISPTERCSSAS